MRKLTANNEQCTATRLSRFRQQYFIWGKNNLVPYSSCSRIVYSRLILRQKTYCNSLPHLAARGIARIICSVTFFCSATTRECFHLFTAFVVRRVMETSLQCCRKMCCVNRASELYIICYSKEYFPALIPLLKKKIVLRWLLCRVVISHKNA